MNYTVPVAFVVVFIDDVTAVFVGAYMKNQTKHSAEQHRDTGQHRARAPARAWDSRDRARVLGGGWGAVRPAPV